MTGRAPTPIDALADRWTSRVLACAPADAIVAGRRPATLDGLGAGPREDLADHAARTLRELARLDPTDDVDEVTLRDLAADLRLRAGEREAGLHLAEIDPVTNPLATLPRALGSLPRATRDDEARLVALIASLPRAVDDWTDAIAHQTATLAAPSRAQVSTLVAQARALAREDGPLASALGVAEDLAVLDSVRSCLIAAAARLEETVLPRARRSAAVGPDLYPVAAERHLGMRIDARETYAWGLEALAAATSAQTEAAHELGASSIEEATAVLAEDPNRHLEGADRVTAWLQETAEAAIDAVTGTHLTVAPGLRRLTARIDPAKRGGAFYTPPSPDGTRPGAITWPADAGAGTFAPWRERTTVHHEGVPGHHLQMGGTALARDLNDWRALLAGSAGHSEGWALYAEAFMDRLGLLPDPADRFGMLDALRFRAARVVIDIGLHLGLQRPGGGGIWDRDHARATLRRSTSMPDAFVDAEVDRYLGWPGQAPAYAIGARVWHDARDAALASGITERTFHDRALALGSVRLDTFAATTLSP
ncbi:DUF885 domain-containing protein [Demequina sp. NBRC 110054]|uniref:DUF885 domain-containing protein n=1 Tax=Demequina sp. NBRC 110054 TaxID=1570343 RepID=UPI0009FDD9D2|nr:DUF885 domain-containing protein [Demequina sp. NBRC 110054]